MQRLWAPWRETYITKVINNQHKGCTFCRILKEKKDEKNYIFLHSKLSFAVLNIYPYSNGHCLILPKRHVGDVSQMTSAELTDMMKTLVKAKALLEKAMNPHAFNVGFNLGRLAGAGIPDHVHMHVVPRWQADHNFMPIVSDTKVISQSLEGIYQALNHANKKRPRRVRR